MGKLKQIHIATKEITKIYGKEGVPEIITYPFWFIFISVSLFFSHKV